MRKFFTFWLMSFLYISTPAQNLCAVFSDNFDWYRYTHEAESKWGIDKSIIMAVIHAESSFRATAMPVKSYLFGMIPWETHSSAFGYSQALKGTWEEFSNDSPALIRSRMNFKDSAEFVAWYLSKCAKSANINPNDAANLYLCYHEGVNGFKKKSYRSKTWLVEKSKSIASNASASKRELFDCESGLRLNHLYFL